MNRKAIIVDLGGTLAHRGERPKESYMERFHEDMIDTTVRDLVNMEYDSGTHIIILTGQREKSREITIQWLIHNGVNFNELVMKADFDTNETPEFKEAYYYQHIQGKVNLKYVLEDREEIVDMWRQMKVRCFQTASGQDREHYKQKAIKQQSKEVCN